MATLSDAIAKARITAEKQYLNQASRLVKTLKTQLVEFGKVIEKRGGKWCVLSEDRSKNLGCYDTKKEAKERLRQIEHFKKAAENFLVGVETEDVGTFPISDPVSAAISLNGVLEKLKSSGFSGSLEGIAKETIKFISAFKIDTSSKNQATTEKGLPDYDLEGGIHLHRLSRDSLNNKLDGMHSHIFIIKHVVEETIDGVKQPAYERNVILVTDEDGAHIHRLPDSAANNTNIDGEHFHKVVFWEEVKDADGYLDYREIELETTEDGTHVHQLQVSTTAFDGLHIHSLELPDGRTVTSSTPGEVWRDLMDSPSQKDLPPLPPSSLFAMLSDEQRGAMRAMDMMTRKAEGESAVVQTLIFSKDNFEKNEAKKWAKNHDFKSGKIDETERSWRIRQRDPDDFKQNSFRTISIDDGIKAVVGRLKNSAEKVDYSKAILPALKLPDPRFIMKRMVLQMSAGMLSTMERRKRVGKDQVLVNELEPLEFDASFAWGIVCQEDPQRFNSFKDIPTDLIEGLDPYTRDEFEKIDGIIYYLPLTLVKSFESPFKLNKPPAGRRLAGKVDLGEDVVKVSKCLKCESPFENPDGLFNFCTECRENESKITKSLSNGLRVKVVKAEENDEERIIFGVVLVPNETDAQDEIYDEREVKNACYSFMEIYGAKHKIMHEGEELGDRVSLLENYLSKFEETWGDEKYPAGTWFQTTRANDDEIWKSVKDGTFTGYSIGGSAVRESLD